MGSSHGAGWRKTPRAAWSSTPTAGGSWRRRKWGRTGPDRPAEVPARGGAPMVAHQESVTGTGLRTPRAAAAAGIVFSLLLGLALVLLLVSAPSDTATAGAWLTDTSRRATIALALNLVPFAGIAFLWFIGVVRDRIGQREDRLFATVFLGSGLLFVALLFVGAAFAGGLIATAAVRPAVTGPGTLTISRQITHLA